jgi:hypothetical protein
MPSRPAKLIASSIAAVAAVTLLAGCSGDDESDHGFAASVPDPCDAITSAQIEAALGSQYDEAKPNVYQSNETQSVCEWWSTTHEGTFVQVLIKSDASLVASERESADLGLGATVDEQVEGATDAYSMLSGAMIGMAVDDYFVQVSNLSGDGGDQTPETIALARIVTASIATT